MKRIKAMNGYTIYQMTARDEKNGEGIEGEYAVFFSSDIREYGVKYSTPEWDGIDSLQEAEWLCNDRENVTYAKARALCEAESTCFSYEDVEEKIEELKQRGIDATAYETADELEEAMEETMNTYRITFQYSENTYCTNIAKAQNADDVEEYYESKGQRVISIEQATDADIREAERKGMPVITIEESEEQTSACAGCKYFETCGDEDRTETCAGYTDADKIPSITIEQRWSRDDVRRTCIEQNWYTCGDCGAYDKMLDMVETSTPTTENIYRVAKDICDHSEYQTISNVMFGLMHDAVLTFYTIDGEEV